MKNNILFIGLLCSLPSPFWASAQQTTAGSKCHKTVTHKSDTGGINEISGKNRYHDNQTAQESFMPRKQYTYMSAVLYVSDLVKNKLQSTDIGLPEDFTYDMSQWQQKDVTEFAACAATFDTYEILLNVMTHAAQTKDGKKPTRGDDGRMHGDWTEDALQAQKVLEETKPTCCQHWDDWAKMIAVAGKTTQSIRDAHRANLKATKQHHSSNIDPKNFLNNVAITDDRVQNIDPQTAFAAAGGVMSPEQAKFDENANVALTKLKAEKSLARAA